MLAYRAQLNFQTAHIIKAADTVSLIVTKSPTYYTSVMKQNIDLVA